MARQAQKSASDVAAKWANNLNGATQTIQKGVMSVTTSPTSLAARNPNAYLQGIQNAVNSGKWQAKLNAVSTSDWQNAMIKKGLPRISTGTASGQPKMQNFMSNFLPYVYQTRDSINSSQPRGTLAQNMQRMTTFVQQMAQYKST
jgi:hypothetical protein